MAEGAEQSGECVPVPPAMGDLHITRTVWPRGKAIHRIHPAIYPANGFNPGKGNARFSPITSSAQRAIPSLYGGSSLECAAMETVFHDTPFAAGFKQVDKNLSAGLVYSQVKPSANLILIDLSAVALRKLGLKRRQLIDTEADTYPATRLWAEAFHAQFADVQGLQWVSRQDDRAAAVLLFGDRIANQALRPVGSSVGVLQDAATYTRLLKLAQAIGVCWVAGKA
jgi:RES domain